MHVTGKVSLLYGPLGQEDLYASEHLLLPLADPGRANDTRTGVRGVCSRIDSQRKREKKQEIDGMTICSRVGKNGITLGAHHLEGGC
ncbi:hypothetical protein NPIL_95181 [Nephila pilipes]|uniref:Uncharacterized protein n=1 Tax=Nephila pilipes TaxID=299642 RepID=A0A8X6TVE2_NEPPI|nr:hypothetical protein NPIL_95181 [Nephila pilipes]